MIRIIVLTISVYCYVSNATSVYDHKMKDIRGKEFDFRALEGKVTLIVNIATKDGYTNHLYGMQELYKKYKNDGFVVIGVPSNEFGKSAPEENRSILSFCKNTYEVDFPLMEKSIITGKNKIALYQSLLDGSGQQEIGWNFVKFLIDKNGKVSYRYNAFIEANSKRVEERVRRLLKLGKKEEKKQNKKIKNLYDDQ